MEFPLRKAFNIQWSLGAVLNGLDKKLYRIELNYLVLDHFFGDRTIE